MLEAIQQLGLEHQIIFNKGAVMVLPPGINKGVGLLAALAELGLSPRNAVGIGDAENDHAFLQLCEWGVAVANALPAIKAEADLVTTGDHGAGVVELIDQLLADDLRSLTPRPTRHGIPLGVAADGQPVELAPHGLNLLVAGTPASGKSTLAAGLMERLVDRGYQFCAIDPEGDFEESPGGVVLGDSTHAPIAAEVLSVLEQPDVSVVVDLLGMPLAERPGFFAELVPGVASLRRRVGRPHWLLVDESHHLLPAWADRDALRPPADLGGLVLLTVHPEHVASSVLRQIDIVLAVGAGAEQTVRDFAHAAAAAPPAASPGHIGAGEALVWQPAAGGAPCRVRLVPTRAVRRRHRRKYAVGDLGAERSFYFRGLDHRLNLAASNLTLFIEQAEQVDEATWEYHLRRGDYARWFRDVIVDEELAVAAERVAARAELPASARRALLRRAIEDRYMCPA